MVYREPTRTELAAAEREIMIRQGERVLAAEAADKVEAEATKNRPAADPTTPRAIFEIGPKRPTDSEVRDFASHWRANYLALRR